MLPISDKVRNYRMKFRPPVYYAIKTGVFWLSAFLAASILVLAFLDVYSRISETQPLLSSLDQIWIFIIEIPLMLGVFQAYVRGIELRHRELYSSSKHISLRAPTLTLSKDKKEYIKEIFLHKGELSALAEKLIQEWEWRRDIKRKAQDPIWQIAIRLFWFPSASNFAAYITGAIAVLAGIVIATISSDTIISSLDVIIADAQKITMQLWLIIVLPIATAVLPVAAILSLMKGIAESILEKIDDQFLSNSSFYRFIGELLELHDRKQRPLQRKTRARIYWIARITTAPIQDIPKIFRSISRAKRLSRPPYSKS